MARSLSLAAKKVSISKRLKKKRSRRRKRRPALSPFAS